jgi:1-acyl-sn-glycerol-3-phosphate acyltransferase
MPYAMSSVQGEKTYSDRPGENMLYSDMGLFLTSAVHRTIKKPWGATCHALLKAYRAAALLLLCTGTLVPAFLIGALPFIRKDARMRMRARCMTLWARACCFLLGMRVITTGPVPVTSPIFIVSNHCSYLDILVIGSLMPAVFISKDDVRSWPLLGLLTQLAGTVFVDRGSKSASVASMEEIRGRLRSGVNVVLFPEGTTNDGRGILDFKSTLFHVPAETDTPLLPVSLRYSHINSLPVTEETKDIIAWYGDMEFLPHFRSLLGLRSITVRVRFAGPLYAAGQGRKVLSSHACAHVRDGYEALCTERDHFPAGP